MAQYTKELTPDSLKDKVIVLTGTPPYSYQKPILTDQAAQTASGQAWSNTPPKTVHMYASAISQLRPARQWQRQ